MEKPKQENKPIIKAKMSAKKKSKGEKAIVIHATFEQTMKALVKKKDK